MTPHIDTEARDQGNPFEQPRRISTIDADGNERPLIARDELLVGATYERFDSGEAALQSQQVFEARSAQIAVADTVVVRPIETVVPRLEAMG